MKKTSCMLMILAALFLVSGCIKVEKTDAESKHDPEKLIGTWQVDEDMGVGDDYYIFREDATGYWGSSLNLDEMAPFHYYAEPMYLEIYWHGDDENPDTFSFRFEGDDDTLIITEHEIEWIYHRIK